MSTVNSSHDLPNLGYRKASTKEVSFLEFVEVSTADSSGLSPDLKGCNAGGQLTAPNSKTGKSSCITVEYSPARPPLPGGHHSFHYEPLRPPAAIIQHSSSLSSNNSNSSSSPSPLVTFPGKDKS